MEIIGLIPAAGKAERISPLLCSKELYPIGFRFVGQGKSMRPKVVSHFLLDKMRKANILKSYIIIRDGKWDIPAYFGNGKMVDMDLAYLLMDLPFGVPFTLDQGYPFVHHAKVAFGFPDIIFEPDDAFVKLIEKQESSGAEGRLFGPAGQDGDIIPGIFHGDPEMSAHVAVAVSARGRGFGGKMGFAGRRQKQAAQRSHGNDKPVVRP